MAKNITVNSKKCELMKAINSPKYGSKTILTNSSWEYVELWLKRCRAATSKDALFYWQQAHNFYNASALLPINAKPLTSYYCCLNAAKALLRVKGIENEKLNHHGITADRYSENNSLSLLNNKVIFLGSGVLAELSKYFFEPVTKVSYSVADLMYNIPCIHRAYSVTFSSTELFIPIRNVEFVKKEASTEAWIQFEVDGRYANAKALQNLPHGYEHDIGIKDMYVVRRKKRFKWDIHSQPKTVKLQKLSNYHTTIRKDIYYIYGESKLWYLKKEMTENTHIVSRSSITLIYAILHWLSELVRYDPQRFQAFMETKQNWLINEFISNGLDQYIDEISCEITGEDIMCTGYRK